MLVANKVDITGARREVTREKAEQLAREHKMRYFEVSAKEGTGVDEVFKFIAQQVADNHRLDQNGFGRAKLSSRGSGEKTDSKCC